MAVVKLLNSKMMPRAGIYDLSEPMRTEDWALEVIRAAKAGALESYIGYQKTADLIAEMTGIPIAVNRGQTGIKDGDTMLIAALNYRPDAPTKGAPVREEDFEFFKAQFWEHAPTLGERMLKVIKDSE